MTRRELYRFVQSLRHKALKDGSRRTEQEIDTTILNTFQLAMFRRRGHAAEAVNGESVLLPLLDFDNAQTLLDEDDLLGRVYQALNASALEAAYRATARDRRKFADDEIPAVTQLFTPRWVVEFLLHQTLGRLWVNIHPDTQIPNIKSEISNLKFQVSSLKSEISSLKFPSLTNLKSQVSNSFPNRAAHIRVLDPACGTMNFGLVAFEMLCAMYQEEFDRAGEPGWAPPSVDRVSEIPAAVLRNNLFGIDIDPIALRLARVSLRLKSGVDLPEPQWNLWCADSLFDPQITKRFAGGFDVVVTNPPYVSARNLPPARVAKMKKHFPAAWRDLYACFIERSLDFARDGGRVGLLVMQSFMFTGSYQKLRKRITSQAALESLVHFGPGLFAIGNPGTLQTVAFIARKEANEARRTSQPLIAIRLVDEPADRKESSLRNALAGSSPLIYRMTGNCFRDLPRQSWAYWVDTTLRRAFGEFPKLGQLAPPRQGLATTDNFRFVRSWWEVTATHADAPVRAAPGRWLPYAKGGQFRRWYEAPRHRVNWENDGQEIKQAIVQRYPYLNGQWQWVAKNTSYYGRGGVTWSYLTSGRFSARRLETGAVFDVAGSSFFPADVPGMLAILNSSAAERLLAAINPTVNFQVGDLAELPIPRALPEELGRLAEAAIRIQQGIDAHDETAPDFISPAPWQGAVEHARTVQWDLHQIEQRIDAMVCGLYVIRPAGPDAHGNVEVDLTDLARRWVSYAIGLLLGRGNRNAPGRVLQIDPPDPRLLAEIRNILQQHLGEHSANELEIQINGLPQFLAIDFFPWHVRLYRRRPIYWALGAPGRMYLLAHDAATRETLAPILKLLGHPIPTRWPCNVDDGIILRLAPLRAIVPDAAMRRVLGEVAADFDQGRFPWARTVPTVI